MSCHKCQNKVPLVDCSVIKTMVDMNTAFWAGTICQDMFVFAVKTCLFWYLMSRFKCKFFHLLNYQTHLQMASVSQRGQSWKLEPITREPSGPGKCLARSFCSVISKYFLYCGQEVRPHGGTTRLYIRKGFSALRWLKHLYNNYLSDRERQQIFLEHFWRRKLAMHLTLWNSDRRLRSHDRQPRLTNEQTEAQRSYTACPHLFS